MFLEKRVYQGSSGRVYPLPVTDRIAEKPEPRAWDAVWIENEYLRIMILPALGGRIHRAQDKTNGYDFIYYQPVIKPALVGLAGPWASGGIEFNWPQHHRPSTFMPADVGIERHADGSATVWLGEHDPMARMKGMHGVRLHPGKSYLELVARAYNRTADVQTFLWWANVATRVHAQYQSFFPPDTVCVADHAKRAMSNFPLCTDRYYGVNYGARARTGVPASETPRQFVPPAAGTRAAAAPAYAPNDLAWYANIPVPTSYMALGSREDFSGGYDHRAHAGLVHIASHHIAPGKKQWTWGNHEFGYAWDRNLTEPDATGEYPPYIELMAGVFTDNQPDFSFLQPGETKTWSQFWYPIRHIGPAQQANVDGAVSLRLERGVARIGVAVTAVRPNATIRLERAGGVCGEWQQSLSPDQPLVFETLVPRRVPAEGFTLRVIAADGSPLLTYTPPGKKTLAALPPAATEPAAPSAMTNGDELFLTGLHLEQYRHATRHPEDYWREALRRDPGDARCNLALGRWHLRRGELADAERHLRASISRLTARNPNPADGEAHYQLGVCLRHQAIFGAGVAASRRETAVAFSSRDQLLDAAYAAFYKSTWSHAWQPAGYHALAEIDARRGEWAKALDHLDRALRVNADNLRARNLQAVALRRIGRNEAAADVLRGTLALDPLDWWARHLTGETLTCDWQVRLDLALDHIHAGLFAPALELLAGDPTVPRGEIALRTDPPAARLPDASLGAAPLVHFYRAWLCHQLGDPRAERRHLVAAAKASADFCFPARLAEIAILEHAITARPRNARARFLLGHLLYDRRRHREALAQWERVVRLEPRNAVAWRNLGLGRFNLLHQPAAARTAYARAVAASPADARLFFERDQLWKRLGEKPARRLRELRRHRALVHQRDDLAVELGALLLQTGRPESALALVSRRRFQPWEGGEGQALGLHVRTHLALGRRALARKGYAQAIAQFRSALTAPENLGEARHLLANPSDVHYWLGTALAAAGDAAGARAAWTTAAEFRGDFQGMSVRAYSAMTYYSAVALQRLGRTAAARTLLRGLLAHARELARTPAVIDYFATSLPTMLLFDDDLSARQQNSARFLEAQARLGLGQTAIARKLLREVLRRDPNHADAHDLLASA
jgi:tetratricopeptide (TPR) repeat protein